MYAYNASYSRKLKQGRPVRFKTQVSSLEIKKQELFEKANANKEPMNLISLAYSFGKLTKIEFDTACFLEQLYMKTQKGLGIKKLPTSSPNTWHITLQNSWNIINASEQDVVAINTWKRIKDFVTLHNQRISAEFFNLIIAYHSYEDLQQIKTGTYNITNILRDGLQIVAKMVELGYL